jgi:Ca2+-binding EF-hand superfamily protein
MAQDAQDVQGDANAEQVFRMFDLDGDGQITAGELRAVLAKLGEEISDGEAVERIRGGDTDADGKISLAEFLVMMDS